TQRLCLEIAQDHGVMDERGVDQICNKLFLSYRAREKDDNLLFVRERMLRSEPNLAVLLDLYSKVRKNRRVIDDEANRPIGILERSGIARAKLGRLRVRNRIYERVFDQKWVTANMPDAELRRQKAAERRGLLRAAAVFAVITTIITALLL